MPHGVPDKPESTGDRGNNMSNVRQATIKVIELCEEGVFSWETVALAALRYMSEDDVADMAHDNEWMEEEEENEE